ncbi:MAG: hypothetical protein PHT15_06940, partial [Gallionellaceae bacterium]|nr:hypothetical protein [Gallionellaceae bacterium]
LEDEAQHLSQSVSVFKLDSSDQPQARRAPAARPVPPARKPAARYDTAAPAKRLADKPKALSRKDEGEEEWAEF